VIETSFIGKAEIDTEHALHDPEFGEAAAELRAPLGRLCKRDKCRMAAGMDEKRQPEPPYWLQQGDESWGPPDFRKHKPYRLRVPSLPSVWRIGNVEREPDKRLVRMGIVWVVLICLVIALFIWLPYVH